VIIRFSCGAGDGLQLTGDRFTQESGVLGNNLADVVNTTCRSRERFAIQPTIPPSGSHAEVHDCPPTSPA